MITLVLVTVLSAVPAAAPVSASGGVSGGVPAARLVPGFDPRLHVKPPLMRTLDGGTAELTIDAAFAERAARAAAAGVRGAPAVGQAVRVGEVLILQGDDRTTSSDGAGNTSAVTEAVARRVIEELGDNFHFITVWMTFPDARTPNATAFEITARNDVRGINLPVRDNGALFGSKGTLRSMLNMKQFADRGGDTEAGWAEPLEVWGQESAHRWLIFLGFIDRRTGKPSDALLGRACAHYARFVDTQGSIEDGLAWQDMRDGTFSLIDSTERYGNLDLYAMGLLAPEDVPPFFIIENIPGYKHPGCSSTYSMVPKPMARRITGTRFDVGIDDIIALHGARSPSADANQDYWREANVVLTLPSQTPADGMLTATRVDRARVWWEAWNQIASKNRQVICTQITKDCGDPRSDVVRAQPVLGASGAHLPRSGPLPIDVEVKNTGGRDTTSVRVTLEARRANAVVFTETRNVGAQPVGATSAQGFMMPTVALPCGAEIDFKAYTQSDFHYQRKQFTAILGSTVRHGDDFEADAPGWQVNPDGNDTAVGTWERARPERTVLMGTPVQPAGAHGGTAAWVTGAAPTGPRSNIYEGQATLQSPAYDARGLRAPVLRYWVNYAGVRVSAANPALVEPSPNSSFVVQVRAFGGPWVEIDRMEAAVTSRWTRRIAKLPPALPLTSIIEFRFIAKESDPGNGATEVAIDDLQITSDLEGCTVATDAGVRAPGGAGDAAATDAVATDAAANDAARAGAPPSPATGCDCRIGAAHGAGSGRRMPVIAPLLPPIAAMLVARWALRWRRVRTRDAVNPARRPPPEPAPPR